MSEGLEARVAELEAQRRALALELDRRLEELFALQELSYVLAQSIALEEVLGRVVRFALDFLRADGAAVLLFGVPVTSERVREGCGAPLRVVAAAGALEPLEGTRALVADLPGAREAFLQGRIEYGAPDDPEPVLPGAPAAASAIAPLRTGGDPLGLLVIVDTRRALQPQQVRLLSTLASQASVVLANSRLYELVRRSTRQWESTFDSLAEGIAVVARDGTMLRANRALARLADTTPAALVGQPFLEVLDAGGAPDLLRVLDAARAGGTPSPVLVRGRGGAVILRVGASPFAGERDETVVAVVEDVTEQQLLQARIIQQDKMASIGQLVSGVAHELNNPLTSIRGLAELLLEQPGLAEEARTHLGVVQAQAERAAHIVGSLLSFARPTPSARTPVDLADVAARGAELAAYDARLHGITLRVEGTFGQALVLGDGNELQQVVLNLVTNAMQALRTLPPEAPREVLLETGVTDGEAWLRLVDTGPGIAPEHVPLLFTPFFTTKAPGEGTGLGLPLSYNIVDAHGGRLAHEPSDGGAAFRVTLPRIAGAPAARRRVLVIDADPRTARLIGAATADDALELTAVATPEEAAALGARGWDVIVADMAVAAAARRLLLPDAAATRLLAIGADQPLTRPLTPRAIRAALDLPS